MYRPVPTRRDPWVNWARLLLLLFVAGVLLGSLAGCSQGIGEQVEAENSPLRARIDKDTGCQYLTYGNGITPRLDRNGKQVCK